MSSATDHGSSASMSETPWSRRKLRMFSLTCFALLLVLLQTLSRERVSSAGIHDSDFMAMRRTSLSLGNTNARSYKYGRRHSQMLPDMPELGGVVVFYNLNVLRTGGMWVRSALQDAQLQASIGHVRFTYREAQNLTELDQAMRESIDSTYTAELIKNVLFVEISGDMDAFHLAPILQQWKAQLHVPFFAFTLVREAISSQMAYWKASRLNEIHNNPQCWYMGHVEANDCHVLYKTLRLSMDWIGRTDQLGEETIPLLFQMMFRRPHLANALAQRFQSHYNNHSIAFAMLPLEDQEKMKQQITKADQELYQSVTRDYTIGIWNNFVSLHPKLDSIPPKPKSYHPQGFLNPYQDPVHRQALLRPPVLTQPNRDKPSSPHTYVMMLWGADPDAISPSNPHPPYTGYLANMLVARQILKDNDSSADFVAIFKMKYGCLHNSLRPQEEELLRSNGIKIRYMPKEVPDFKSFYQKYSPRGLQGMSWDLDSAELVTKLWVFGGMTDYTRVIFLDGDVIPLTNLDYLFELSQGPSPIVKENVVLSTYSEPVNAGLFMIQPNRTAYADMLQLIADRGDTVGVASRWDAVQGWGHVIEGEDKWETNNPDNNGQEWNYLVANSDQGMLYHYPKYVLQSMTQILSRKVINFGPGPNGTVIIEKIYNVTHVEESPFYNYSDPESHVVFARCDAFGYAVAPGYPGCVPPYADHAHYSGNLKPWDNPPAPPGTNDTILWWETLRSLQSRGVNITFQEVVAETAMST